MDSAGSGSEWISGTAAATTAFGTLTLVLFPFAIPIVALTLVFAVPLLLPLVALAALAAVIAGLWLLLRAGARGIGRIRRLAGRRAPATDRANSSRVDERPTGTRLGARPSARRYEERAGRI